MVTLDAGNVLLKPSQRRHLMACLRRSVKLGQRVGKFILTITLQRIGRGYLLVAHVRDSLGQFQCRIRSRDFAQLIRDTAWDLSHRLHDQRLQGLAVA